jgi:hypothetical protein
MRNAFPELFSAQPLLAREEQRLRSTSSGRSANVIPANRVGRGVPRGETMILWPTSCQ